MWEISIAGEGSTIATIRAPDERLAHARAVELIEKRYQDLGAAFDPKWVRVTLLSYE